VGAAASPPRRRPAATSSQPGCARPSDVILKSTTTVSGARTAKLVISDLMRFAARHGAVTVNPVREVARIEGDAHARHRLTPRMSSSRSVGRGRPAGRACRCGLAADGFRREGIGSEKVTEKCPAGPRGIEPRTRGLKGFCDSAANGRYLRLW